MSVLQIEDDGPVRWLVLNRPEARNALNRALRDALADAFTRAEADPGVQVIVLTGAGEAFCAGGDLKEMAEAKLEVPPPDFVPQLGRTLQVSKPVIAAVNGAAYGGGFLLAQNCDLCYAADTARFAISEARWGRGAPWAARLATQIPSRVAMQLLLTARPLTAQRAHEIGLVNEVTDADGLRELVRERARQIAENAPLSVRAGKAMVHGAMGRSADEAFALAESLFEVAYRSEDAQEGPRAFREGRPPRFGGR